MRTLPSLFAVMTLLAALPAAAEVAVAPVKVRDGYFRDEQCTPEASPAELNECICKADIVKAQVAGLAAPVMTAINNQLAQLPERLATESCSGIATKEPGKDIRVNEVSASYKTVYESPTAMSVLVSYWTFGAGAAHPMHGSEGYTLDLTSGRTINPAELLGAEQLAKANVFLRTALLKEYGEMMFDEAKERTEPFLTDGNCEDCTLYYTKDGWKLRFQIYAITPYVVGQPEITLPTSLIPAPETLITMKKK